MNRHIFLSYFLDKKTPLYGGSKGIEIVKLNDILNGDTANTKKLTLHNHSGTHIDFPNHFINNGKVSNDYNADFWIFNNPYLIELDVSENEIILLSDEQINLIPSNTDFLILKTGFYKYRKAMKFWNNNPGIHPELAKKIKTKCPNLKVLGMDLISLTSYQNRELGRIAHKKFLGENDILLVEDMKLDKLFVNPIKIMCFPMMVKGLDGAPVSIIAEL